MLHGTVLRLIVHNREVVEKMHPLFGLITIFRPPGSAQFLSWFLPQSLDRHVTPGTIPVAERVTDNVVTVTVKLSNISLYQGKVSNYFITSQ